MSDQARLAALDLMAAVELDGAYANLTMPAILKERRLRGRDAAFATELAYGALRGQGWYDAIIASASGRDIAALDVGVRDVLRLGAHQWIAMRTPAHAAVSATVNLVREGGMARASGLVNACMRRIVEREPEAWEALLAPSQALHDLALRNSQPLWVARGLAASLDARGKSHELEELLRSQNEPAAVTLVARPGLIGRAELADAVGGEPTQLSPYGVALAGGSPGDAQAVRDGRAAVQDEGSQLVAAALAADAARPATEGERWLDACAGPGGKAALLGAVAAARGATLDAVELHAHRARLVSSAVRALPDGVVSVHVGDAKEVAAGPYDRILLDAPCSGLGALRRRPEARWRKSEADLDALLATQSSLLASAKGMLAPGGVIAYVTCSPLLEETTTIVGASGLELIDARLALAEVSGADAASFGDGLDVQLWTHTHGTDCMYLALLRPPSGR